VRCDLIIPALNEAPNIGPLFDALEPLRSEVIRHVIVADNGSTDGTAAAAAAGARIIATIITLWWQHRRNR
jgi:glycosyltransferase involved in cell wall biosynthesis